MGLRDPRYLGPEKLVGETGFEPALLSKHDPKSCASASSATRPKLFLTMAIRTQKL